MIIFVTKFIYMKKVIFLFLVFSINFSAFSQEYKWAFGARIGSSIGISGKAFLSASDTKFTAAELILGRRYGGNNVTGLFEFQKELHISGMRYATLYYYAGAGGHLGSYKALKYSNRQNVLYSQNVLALGVDGVLGLEYVFADFPVSVGVDVRPFFDFVNPGYNFFDAGFTLRYCINK